MKIKKLKNKLFFGILSFFAVASIPALSVACSTKESIEQKEAKFESSLEEFFEVSFKFKNHNLMDEKMLKESLNREKESNFKIQKSLYTQQLNFFKNNIEKEDYANYLDLMNGVLEVAVDVNKDINYLKYLDEILSEISIKINDSNIQDKKDLSSKEKEVESKIVQLKEEALNIINKIPNNIWNVILSSHGVEISRIKNLINSIDLSFFVRKAFSIASNINSSNQNFYNRTLDNILKLTNTIITFSKTKTVDKISSSLIAVFNKYKNN